MNPKLLSLKKKLEGRIRHETNVIQPNHELIKLLQECEANIFIDNVELYDEVDRIVNEDDLPEKARRIIRSMITESRVQRGHCERMTGLYRQSQIDLEYYKKQLHENNIQLVRPQENIAK